MGTRSAVRAPLSRALPPEPGPATIGAWRLVRGLVVGAAATSLALGGHVLAGGAAPHWMTTVAVALALGVVATWLSHLHWTFPRLLALLVVAQQGLHVLFSAAQPEPAAGALTQAAVAHGAHHEHLSGLARLSVLAPPHPGSGTPLLTPDTAMVMAHLLAAAVTALLLCRGETWLTGVLEALALRAARLLEATLTVPVARPVPVRVRVVAPRPRHPAGPRWQRGPPR